MKANRIMSKAEEYIRKHINHFSNLDGFDYIPWLSSDKAGKVAEIAREEMLNDICEWIEENIGEYCDGENIMFSAIHIENIDVFGQERFINDLKRAMKDE